ncbi:hypothetical protein FNV43_RR18939 [Rhamnella rubrinervis]|uniref:Pentatricopeptide repeat-containing protein n=1 Tax=Rhamnella rubrinervis TaxID=2594499 RepID=A0A8K0E793_9ROSA|nr:hypothetical protein FNV43_RR18939 [Rhamnella rubrinervis]
MSCSVVKTQVWLWTMDSITSKVINVSHLRQFHAHLIRNSLHHHNQWVALLLAHCTRLRAPLFYTRLIFDSAPQPDIHVFTSMLKYYTHLGTSYVNEVVSLYQQMQACDVQLATFVYPVLVKSVGKAGIVFHAHVVKLGIDCDHFVRNAIMGVYAKYGLVEHAKELFDEMHDRTIADWNSMISGYWKSGNEAEVRRLFDMMPERNVITWTAMVTGYAKMKDLEKARDYFDQMAEKNVVSWNAMLSGYAQNGFGDEALKLFNDMMNSRVQPNETTWVIIISSCSLRGDPVLADSLVRTLNQRQVHLSYLAKTALVDMYAKCGSLRTARKLFDELGNFRNSVTWNAMISAYTRVGDLKMARELFDKMPERDVVSWNSMISGYAQNGESAMAIELFKDMIYTETLKPDEVTMHGRCQSVFEGMAERDLVSYNTLVAGFAAHGYGREAVKLLSKMKEEGIEPDRVTYIGVLTACSHAGLLEEGRSVFNSIKDPDVDHYACLVDLFGRVGDLDEAKN